MVYGINCVTFVSKYGLLEILLEKLKEEGVVVNYEHANEVTYTVVKDLNSSKNPTISGDKVEWKGRVSITLDSFFSLSKSQGDTVTELEEFIEKNSNKIVTHKKGRKHSPCKFLVAALEKQLKTQSGTIFYFLKKGL